MTKEALKKRIVELLEQRSDATVLRAVHELLEAPGSGRGLKTRLERAVLEGEKDIATGRSMSLSAFEKRIKSSLQSRIGHQPR
ncbi:MAG: hypothetical protein JNM62_09655 [Flavobacteriales bacterium]|nr:hypothetical protein [Flavobacteriales bacterium]